MSCTNIDFYDSPPEKISQLYDELTEISLKQSSIVCTAIDDGYGGVVWNNSNYVPINVNPATATATATGGGGASGSTSGGIIWTGTTGASSNGTVTISGNVSGFYPVTYINGFLPVEPPPLVEMKKDSNGCTCTKCNELYPYAEPPVGKAFVCYGCRMVW